MKYIPKNLVIGFDRQITEDDEIKAAFVTYKDEKGVLRKEKSFNSWVDKNEPILEAENTPLSGFRLGGRAGGGSGDIRMAWIILIDPRNFLIEIELSDFLSILDNCNIIDGVLSNSFVYSFEGIRLCLLDTTTDEYKKCVENTKLVDSPQITPKKSDLIPGRIYSDKNGEDYKYLTSIKGTHIFRNLKFDEYNEDDDNDDNDWFHTTEIKSLNRFIRFKEDTLSSYDKCARDSYEFGAGYYRVVSTYTVPYNKIKHSQSIIDLIFESWCSYKFFISTFPGELFSLRTDELFSHSTFKSFKITPEILEKLSVQFDVLENGNISYGRGRIYQKKILDKVVELNNFYKNDI